MIAARLRYSHVIGAGPKVAKSHFFHGFSLHTKLLLGRIPHDETYGPIGTYSGFYMQDGTPSTIEALLVQNLPKDLLMGIQEGLPIGAQRAHQIAVEMKEGHRASVMGHLRHFQMNEVFHEALEAAGAAPNAIRGNGVVIGRSGIFSIGRFNVSGGIWNNAKRSRTRREMSEANRVIELLRFPDLFDPPQPVEHAVVFFVACFSGSLKIQPEAPLQMDIAVPDSAMKGWIFREPLPTFLLRYEVPVPAQEDGAVPKLKKKIEEWPNE